MILFAACLLVYILFCLVLHFSGVTEPPKDTRVNGYVGTYKAGKGKNDPE